jgi:hypothetical protein
MIGGFLLGLALPAVRGMSSDMFERYRSTQQQLPVAFEYPATWRVEESSGSREAYQQVQIYGPDTLDARMRTYLVVRAVPPQAAGGRYVQLTDMIESYRRTLMPSFRIEREQEVAVWGVPATQLDLGGHLRLPWQSPTAEEVPVTGQRLFLEKNGLLYELGWLATPESAPSVTTAFGHLLETLTAAN